MGWFKKPEYEITVANTNPFVKVQQMQSYSIKPDQKFYKKPLFNLGVGFVSGILISQAIK